MYNKTQRSERQARLHYELLITLQTMKYKGRSRNLVCAFTCLSLHTSVVGDICSVLASSAIAFTRVGTRGRPYPPGMELVHNVNFGP